MSAAEPENEQNNQKQQHNDEPKTNERERESEWLRKHKKKTDQLWL